MLVHEIAAYPGTPISRLANIERSEKFKKNKIFQKGDWGENPE